MSCLFNSIGTLLNVDPTLLREQVCEFIGGENTKLIPGIETNQVLGTDVDMYVESMKKTSTWGGGVEIQAVCQLFDVEVVVWDTRLNNTTKIHFRSHLAPTNGEIKVIHINWNGGHYTPR
jgi:hypothetical protein